MGGWVGRPTSLSQARQGSARLLASLSSVSPCSRPVWRGTPAPGPPPAASPTPAGPPSSWAAYSFVHMMGKRTCGEQVSAVQCSAVHSSHNQSIDRHRIIINHPPSNDRRRRTRWAARKALTAASSRATRRSLAALRCSRTSASFSLVSLEWVTLDGVMNLSPT